MIFSEIYSAYYHTVAAILREAVHRPLTEGELRRIVEEQAFGESTLTIPAALREERWQLLKADGTTPLKHAPTMPLTLLEKQWLKAISCDPRIQLFGKLPMELDDVKPLFRPQDVCVFDQYGDGDNYSDPEYQKNFRLILEAIREQKPLYIEIRNRRGEPVQEIVQPDYLEYSEKDDKFRLIGAGRRLGGTINLGRIVSCRPCEASEGELPGRRNYLHPRSVIFELTDERKALERVLLHFAHFKKQAERLEGKRYRVVVYYDKEDESEVVIRMLSFGPLVRVTAPNHFVELMRNRLKRQMGCEIGKKRSEND